MNKPKITTELLVQLTSAAPARVQKRLDKNPQAANEWDWSEDKGVIKVDTGTQTVTMTPVDGVVQQADQMQCDCLLAPKCLHLLACVTLLEIQQETQTADVPDESSSPSDETIESDATTDAVQADETTVRTAAALFDSASQIVVTGYERASTVIIGQLMQAAHHARAIGLHWPAASAIRVVEGIRQQRISARGADATTLRRDMFELLSSSRMIQQQTTGWQKLPGTARRKYHPRDEAMKLQGVFVEPVLTDNGYAGMVVYLKDESHNWFTISDVRLGDAERLAGVWKGGIPIGNKSVPANDLMSCRVTIRGGGVSDDSRLGLGSKAELALQHGKDWLSESMQQWVSTDLATQMRRVWTNRHTPDLARPAGWDLVGLQVEVLGASGSHLVARILESGRRVPLGVMSENTNLEYRRNLQRLAAAPGMLLNVVARFDFTRPAALLPLAIAPLDESVLPVDENVDAEESSANDNPPRPKLVLPDTVNGCWQLGWQRLQPEHFSRTSEPVVLSEDAWTTTANATLDPMQRRIQAMLQGGHHSIPDLSSDSLQIDAARYLEAWYETAAVVLMELSTASATLRAAETKRETAEAILRLSELWIAGEAWCETIELMEAAGMWIPEGVVDSTT